MAGKSSGMRSGAWGVRENSLSEHMLNGWLSSWLMVVNVSIG